MKRTLTGLSVAMVCSAVIALGAQSDMQSSKGDRSMKDSKTVTLTGCLKEGTDPNTFTLTNVSGDLPDKMSGTSGSSSSSSAASGSASESGAKTGSESESVELVANSKLNLKEHVGHKVQITGTVEGMSSNPQGESAGTSGTAASGTSSPPSSSSSSSESSMHKVRVKSLKHISETCS
jgi:hypothetical protein